MRAVMFFIKKVFMFCLMLAFTGRLYAQEVLTVAVASNFKPTLEQLIKKQNLHNIRLVSASTGKLFAQIKNGAPFDVFLAADSESVEQLVALHLGIAETQVVYAQGELILWSLKLDDNNLKQSYNNNEFNKIALANPAHAPYGKAAMDLLLAKGFTKESLNNKMVLGENVAQAFQFIATEAVDFGFIAKSQWIIWQQQQPHKSGAILEFDRDTYRPITQSGVVIKTELIKQNAEAFKQAQQFLQWISSDVIQAELTQMGYTQISLRKEH